MYKEKREGEREKKKASDSNGMIDQGLNEDGAQELRPIQNES